MAKGIYKRGSIYWIRMLKKSGADRDRTDDLLNAIQALSQLSYSPAYCDK